MKLFENAFGNGGSRNFGHRPEEAKNGFNAVMGAESG